MCRGKINSYIRVLRSTTICKSSCQCFEGESSLGKGSSITPLACACACSIIVISNVPISGKCRNRVLVVMPAASAISFAVGSPLPSIMSRLAVANIRLRVALVRSRLPSMAACALIRWGLNSIAVQHLAAPHITAAVLIKAIASVHNAAVVPDNKIQWLPFLCPSIFCNGHVSPQLI